MCHSTTELKRRSVRADSRTSTGETLETKLPRSVYLDSMQNLPEKVMQSGCRDEAPTKEVLKTIAWSQRQLKRPHSNELLSLQRLINEKKGSDNKVLQRVMMHHNAVVKENTDSVLQKVQGGHCLSGSNWKYNSKRKLHKSNILCV